MTPRPQRSLLAACGLLLLGSLAPACSIDSARNPRFGCDGCPDDQCHMGFCFAPQSDGGGVILDGGGMGTEDGGGVGTGDGGTDGGTPPPPEDCDEPGATEFCYGGPEGTATEGACRAGMRVCEGTAWGACLGQVTPDEERCNDVDDDCDGTTDEEVMLGSCDTEQPGACASGALRCEAGVAFCDRAVDPAPETCNGEDDDCDSELDEDIDARCFPMGASGCTADGMGGFVCQGICQAGTQVCNGGVAEPCDDFVIAGDELCNTGGGTAADENCDGTSDENCTCTPTTTQMCYSGPEGTAGHGECMAGEQTCTASSTWGPCEEEIMPVPETCLNEMQDNDCNDARDDILRRGEPCSTGGGNQEGVCEEGTFECPTDGTDLECVPRDAHPEACNSEDDDCDSKTDETFDLSSDPLNCGMCGNPCRDGEACCNGECADLSNSERYCGNCMNPCGNGLECCNGDCANTQTDPMNCGQCGRTCGIAGTGCCEGGMCVLIGGMDPLCL